jgi:predicted nucleotidyltransferase
MQVPTAVAASVRELRDALRAQFGSRLADVRLFGSYARGDWGPESDVDVLVVVTGLTEAERRRVFELGWEVFTRRLVHLSPLALSDVEWQTLCEREYRLARDIEREGIRP